MKAMLVKLLTAWLFRITSAESILYLSVQRMREEGRTVEIKLKGLRRAA